jgi:hypothetical protein
MKMNFELYIDGGRIAGPPVIPAGKMLERLIRGKYFQKK